MFRTTALFSAGRTRLEAASWRLRLPATIGFALALCAFGLVSVTADASQPARAADQSPVLQPAPDAPGPNLQLSWLSPDVEATNAVAWGDVDGDGDLDLAVGNKGLPNRLILNQGGALGSSGWVAAKADNTTSLAWGDVDGDDDLDLVVGNAPAISGAGTRAVCKGGQEQLYRNDNGQLSRQPVWSSKLCDSTGGVALGDVDGDGDLDLAVANSAPRQQCPAIETCALAKVLVYGNADGVFGGDPIWTADLPGDYHSPAWGDVDGDGDLDLAVASGKGIHLFVNQAGSLPTTADAVIAPDLSLWRIAWGDLDGRPVVGCDQPGLDLIAVGSGTTVIFTNQCGKFDAGRELSSRFPAGSRPQPQGAASERPANARLAWRLGDLARPDASLALGDVDSDGDLDLITGASCSATLGVCKLHLHLNANGLLKSVPAWTSTDDVYASSLAWGDVDNDGDPDLAVGAGGYVDASNRLYRNADLPLEAQPSQVAPDVLVYSASAWGDSDGDGRQDLAIGELGGQPALISGNSLGGDAVASWQPDDANALSSLAWGDVDGDGDLDLAVGNASQCAIGRQPEECEPGRNRLYLNAGGSLATTAAWTSAESDNSTSLAWGDVDGDGDLDLAVGNRPACTVDAGADAAAEQRCAGGEDRLYLNEAGVLLASPAWTTRISDTTTALAWGDVDGDGDLDLAVGNQGQPGRLYLNEAGMLRVEPGWTSARAAATVSLAWGDVDGDGDLDLAVGNLDEAARLYRNDKGQLERSFSWSSLETHPMPHLAWGDVDGDGDLDLAVHDQLKTAVYENTGSGLSSTAGWTQELAEYGVPAWVDVDGDGDPDLSVGARVFRNVRIDRLAAGGLPQLTVRQPDRTARAELYFTSEILSGAPITISYALSTSQPAGLFDVRGYYSVNGPGAWVAATPYTGTQTTRLTAGEHVFLWNTTRDGLLGQSDAMVFRLVAIPRSHPQAASAPGLVPHGSSNAATAPFRVRGTQVRVFDRTLDDPVAAAEVYRLAAGQVDGAEILGNALGPFRTNADGQLPGRGEIKPGDQLVALWPPDDAQPAGARYRLYYTSARPTKTGLDAARVQDSGVQDLVVSSDNPLILFDLDVSLEWDARRDPAFLQELEQAFRRASEIFYDLSNGQMALGDVRIWQNKEYWLQSDVIIYASGSVRPRASLGGVVDRARDDVSRDGRTIPAAFLPGQVRMGAVWDPFGQSRADLGRDWWRALAHELAHHLLYLPDDYLGYSKARNVVTVDCHGSFMTTAYDDAYSEFLDFSGISPKRWPGECKQTLAAETTGRSDWETIETFYPAVFKPSATEIGDNPGPAALPLAVTRVSVQEPQAKATTFPARAFDLRDEDGNRLPVPQGQGYLFKTQGNEDPTDDVLVPLGSTGQADFIKVRGASTDDRLCVFDFSARPARQGCIDKLDPLTNTIRLVETPEWAPGIQVAPASQPALSIRVAQPFTGSQSSITAVPVQPNAAVSVTQLIPRVALVTLAPAEGAHGFSVAISPTRSISNGPVGFEVLQLAGGSLAISSSAPEQPGSSVAVTISQPALLVTVTQAISQGQLAVQILPAYGSLGSPVFSMTQALPGIHSALVQLDFPVYAGYVRISLQLGSTTQGGDPKSNREAIAPFYFAAKRLSDGRYAWGERQGVTLGPDSAAAGGLLVQLTEAQLVGFGPNDRGGFGPNDRGGFGPDVRGFNANRRAVGAPIASSDGHVSIFNRLDVFGVTATASLQALPALPGLPTYLTPVGQGYRFVSSADTSRIIEFGYIQREVPQGYEHTLVIYYSGDDGKTWRRLPTALEVDDNQATAPADHSGLYVLVSSVDVPFYSAGWNLFSYPIPADRPVVAALQSISGTYTTVYGYDGANLADPWQIYDVRAPDWANDLTSLAFGRGYWINVSRPITLQLQVVSGETVSRTTAVTTASAVPASQRTPPAVYYGLLPPDLPEGAPVTAWIDPPPGTGGKSQRCGQARVLPGDKPGERWYIVKVDAADTGPKAGCGAPGKDVTFKLGEALAQTEPWDNTAPVRLDLVAR